MSLEYQQRREWEEERLRDQYEEGQRVVTRAFLRETIRALRPEFTMIAVWLTLLTIAVVYLLFEHWEAS